MTYLSEYTDKLMHTIRSKGVRILRRDSREVVFQVASLILQWHLTPLEKYGNLLCVAFVTSGTLNELVLPLGLTLSVEQLQEIKQTIEA